ncbi:MAG: hypothetical protein AB1941_10000 [Gemmatimonadota bacterium]
MMAARNYATAYPTALPHPGRPLELPATKAQEAEQVVPAPGGAGPADDAAVDFGCAIQLATDQPNATCELAGRLFADGLRKMLADRADPGIPAIPLNAFSIISSTPPTDRVGEGPLQPGDRWEDRSGHVHVYDPARGWVPR